MFCQVNADSFHSLHNRLWAYNYCSHLFHSFSSCRLTAWPRFFILFFYPRIMVWLRAIFVKFHNVDPVYFEHSPPTTKCTNVKCVSRIVWSMYCWEDISGHWSTQKQKRIIIIFISVSRIDGIIKKYSETTIISPVQLPD